MNTNSKIVVLYIYFASDHGSAVAGRWETGAKAWNAAKIAHVEMTVGTVVTLYTFNSRLKNNTEK